jgi:hypothetical protein
MRLLHAMVHCGGHPRSVRACIKKNSLKQINKCGSWPFHKIIQNILILALHLRAKSRKPNLRNKTSWLLWEWGKPPLMVIPSNYFNLFTSFDFYWNEENLKWFLVRKRKVIALYKINTSYHSSLKIVLVYDINCNL